jgi:hypothetical protein
VSPQSSDRAQQDGEQARVAIERDIAGARRKGRMMRKWVATPIAMPRATDSANASTVGIPSSRHT